ncbi:MAG: hypothetical protein IT555_14295 [Acetobacteraceae bacterium]|nr:hypothetical protein [Acetobacteraceae bacterium]
MLAPHPPLADQAAALRAAAAVPCAPGWLPAPLHALIMACLLRLFGRLEQLILLWQDGRLPARDIPTATPALRAPIRSRPRRTRGYRARRRTRRAVAAARAGAAIRPRAPWVAARGRPSPHFRSAPPLRPRPAHGPPATSAATAPGRAGRTHVVIVTL